MAKVFTLFSFSRLDAIGAVAATIGATVSTQRGTKTDASHRCFFKSLRFFVHPDFHASNDANHATTCYQSEDISRCPLLSEPSGKSVAIAAIAIQVQMTSSSGSGCSENRAHRQVS